MKANVRRGLIAQLTAHRDTLLAAATQTEASLILLGVDRAALGHAAPAPDDEGCPHPPEQLRDDSTLGAEEYTCRACGETFDHHPHLKE